MFGFEALEFEARSDRDALVRSDADQVILEKITSVSDDGQHVVVEILGDGTVESDLAGVKLDGIRNDGAPRFFGDNGDETFSGTALVDRLEGRDGNDRLKGEGGDDTLDGGNGNDTIDGRGGRVTLDGGVGKALTKE